MTDRNKSSFALHQWQNVIIFHATEDITIKDGRIIPKGYVNATQMCKANKKTWSNYIKSEKAKSFSTKLSTTLLNGRASIITIEGGVTTDIYGTYVHPLLAKHLALWLSDDFALWAIVVIDAVINGDFKALTPEAEEAQRKVQDIWEQIRTAGKATRRLLTDSIKEWYIRNPNGTSRPPHVMYAITTNAIYQALWKMDALELEDFLGCGRHEVRDNIDLKSLKTLDRAEANVMEYIDLDNIKPVDAVALANIRNAGIPGKK